MFSGSGSNKIKLALDDNSTLFVLDNTAPTNTSISLRSINADSINNFLGNSVEIDLANSSKMNESIITGSLLDIWFFKQSLI